MGKSNASRLAKNTVVMYIRMLLLMGIGFFTSRVLLQKLGITDFGIYGVVGSIIAMFGSIRGLFVTSTQRYLNFEMGRDNKDGLKTVFNTSILVNMAIALIFVLAVEVIGVWFIYEKISAEGHSTSDLLWLLHLSVVTSMVYILTTPYDALMVAHEDFSTYAFLTILDHLLKLGIIYLLWMSSNRLVFYALLLLLVAIMMRVIYHLYCHRKYTECRINFKTDRILLKQMTSFAGWQFFGNTAFALTHNGLNMLLNVFGGPAVNAARSIAYQANASINQLVVNMSLVLSPYSVKQYASNNKQKMFDLFFFSSKVMFFVSVCVMIPVLLFTENIIVLWLGQVPSYSIEFIQILMYYGALRALHTPVDTLFKSVGNIRNYQMTEGITLAMPMFFSWVALKNGYSVVLVFVFVLIFEVLNLVNIIRLARKVTGLDTVLYFRRVAIPAFVCLALIYALNNILVTVSDTLVQRLIPFLLSVTMVFAIIYRASFTRTERMKIMEVIKKNVK